LHGQVSATLVTHKTIWLVVLPSESSRLLQQTCVTPQDKQGSKVTVVFIDTDCLREFRLYPALVSAR